jgi:hypothetical protein
VLKEEERGASGVDGAAFFISPSWTLFSLSAVAGRRTTATELLPNPEKPIQNKVLLINNERIRAKRYTRGKSFCSLTKETRGCCKHISFSFSLLSFNGVLVFWREAFAFVFVCAPPVYYFSFLPVPLPPPPQFVALRSQVLGGLGSVWSFCCVFCLFVTVRALQFFLIELLLTHTLVPDGDSCNSHGQSAIGVAFASHGDPRSRRIRHC